MYLNVRATCVLMHEGGTTDSASMYMGGPLAWVYLIWLLHDPDLQDARAAKADAEDQHLRYAAAMRRDAKMRAIGSEATFFSGLARIDGEFRSVRVAVTPEDFVVLDDWTHLDPDTELARFPRESVTEVVIVDENGNEVADQLINPIRELETSKEERYAVVLKRHDASGHRASRAGAWIRDRPAPARPSLSSRRARASASRLVGARGRGDPPCARGLVARVERVRTGTVPRVRPRTRVLRTRGG
jgi:hypothetical protein